MARGFTKRARGGRQDLPVYICEYHDEALRCLHHAIRRRRMPFSDLTMVHFDAHPDLGASATMSAETVFESPHDVYAAMRADPGGIAQWILPAVYGGHYRCVWWVRPAWAVQIADGCYDVAVGRARKEELGAPAATAMRTAPPKAGLAGGSAAPGATLPTLDAAGELPETIFISCREPYFVEDGIYCPEAELTAAKPLRLVVSELPGGGPGGPAAASAAAAAVAADVDSSVQTSALAALAGQAWTLDVCLDYFACGNPFLRQTRPSVAAPFAAVQNCASCRQSGVTEVDDFLAQRDAFDKAYNTVLKEAIADDADDAGLSAALDALEQLLPEARRQQLLGDLNAALDEARDSELQEILEAVDMVTLPLHPVTEAELRERLAAFEGCLGRLLAAGGRPPAAVTIARSVVDGFCPMRWHCFLEQGVLEILRRCLGDLDVVYSDELDAMENV